MQDALGGDVDIYGLIVAQIEASKDLPALAALAQTCQIFSEATQPRLKLIGLNKRTFRIDGGRYGGELVMGPVSEAFAQYWFRAENKEDLPEYLWGEHEDHPDAPLPGDDGECEWYDFDEYEHLSAPVADQPFTVTEVTGTDDTKQCFVTSNDSTEVDPVSVYSREAGYLADSAQVEESAKQRVAVMVVLSAEKGSFGSWFVSTFFGLDFNPELLAVGIVETELGEFVEALYYNRRQLEPDYDYCDSRGKSFEAKVGWICIEDRDPEGLGEVIDDELWQDCMDCR